MNTSPSKRRARKLAVLALLASPLTAALATDGYFSHGYGMKAKGMGGASVAMTDNAFAGANNPATAAWAGERLEVGVDVFSPERSMARTGSAAGLNAAVTSDSTTFLIPELGYNHALSEQLGVGPDMAIVRLHIGAIARAARAEDEVSQMSDVVAKELAALVNHKLTEIKALLA